MVVRYSVTHRGERTTKPILRISGLNVAHVGLSGGAPSFLWGTKMPIEDLARSDVVISPSKTSVTKLTTTMAEQDVGSIVITADDLTELLADEQQQLAEIVRAQRPPY